MGSGTLISVEDVNLVGTLALAGLFLRCLRSCLAV